MGGGGDPEKHLNKIHVVTANPEKEAGITSLRTETVTERRKSRVMGN